MLYLEGVDMANQGRDQGMKMSELLLFELAR